MRPVITERRELTNTAPALTSLAYFTLILKSWVTVSHKASIALFIVSDIRTMEITKLKAIHSK